MARDHLAIPAMSAPLRSVFSDDGNVVQCWASGTQVLPEGVGQVGTHLIQLCSGRCSVFPRVLEYSWVAPGFSGTWSSDFTNPVHSNI